MKQLRRTIGFGFIFSVHFFSLFFALFIDMVGNNIAIAIDSNIAIPNDKFESFLLIYLFVGTVTSFVFLIQSMNSIE